MSGFSPASKLLVGEFQVNGRCDDVFPLFSPIGEKHWVPGWAPELLHPVGETWAQGMIFRTREETGDAVWVVTRLDRRDYAVEYHRVEPDRYVARVEVHCRPADAASGTGVRVAYEFVGLSTRGNDDIAAMRQRDFDGKMNQWASRIGAYLDSMAL